MGFIMVLCVQQRVVFTKFVEGKYLPGAAKEWPAFGRWTDEYLLSNFFDLRFYVDLRKHHSTSKPVRTKMNLGKFLSNYR